MSQTVQIQGQPVCSACWLAKPIEAVGSFWLCSDPKCRSERGLDRAFRLSLLNKYGGTFVEGK